jgi:hypothetical protein
MKALELFKSCITFPKDPVDQPLVSISQPWLNLETATKIAQNHQSLLQKAIVEEALGLLTDLQEELLLSKFDRIRIIWCNLPVYEIVLENNTSGRTVCVYMDQYHKRLKESAGNGWWILRDLAILWGIGLTVAVLLVKN